uniref:Uncharacterized protein n=1 Tax=Amphimedon queenslandica TaxID=400682 RepID=A0A1X7SI39_AMPQE
MYKYLAVVLLLLYNFCFNNNDLSTSKSEALE